MRDLRSAETIAKWEREAQAREAERKRLRRQLEAQLAVGADWQPIEACPFAALDQEYGIDGLIWVSDGKEVALATVQKRFGRPLRFVTQPEMVVSQFELTGK
jgi:hypothetical protein